MARPVIAQTLRLARCWNIQRTNAAPIRITDHNCELFVLGVTYSPIGGFNITTTQTDGEAERDVRVDGVISQPSDPTQVFTFDDFRAGLFREAKIVEYVVDWKYPWHGSVDGRTRTYWMGESNFNEETFSAPLEGVSRFMKQVYTKRVGKLCDYDVYDTDTCKATTVGNSWSCFIDTVTDRNTVRFSGGGLTTGVDFVRGKITWTNGTNNGFTMNVRSQTDHGDGSYTVDLATPLQYDASASDAVSVFRGCDRRIVTCATFASIDADPSNEVNFGGEPEIPGFNIASNVNRSKKN